jgi:RimJ/RimL family protein N-acetyltransferase
VLRPDYPISTARLLLRPFTKDDLAALHDIQSRPEVHTYLYSAARDLDETRELLYRRLSQAELRDEDDALVLAIQRRDTGAMVGDVLLRWTSRGHQQGEIGYVLHPDHHRRGFAGEAAVQLLRLGFDRLGMHRIVGRCDGRNVASATVMARLGMRREAHLRENEFVKGEWTDEYVYAMLRSEWSARVAG